MIISQAQDIVMIFGQQISSLGMFGMELAGTAESFYMSSDLVVTSIDRTSQFFNQNNDSVPRRSRSGESSTLQMAVTVTGIT
jgi:hypothetical protein